MGNLREIERRNLALNDRLFCFFSKQVVAEKANSGYYSKKLNMAAKFGDYEEQQQQQEQAD